MCLLIKKLLCELWKKKKHMLRSILPASSSVQIWNVNEVTQDTLTWHVDSVKD